ncbi:hypothetical protein [Pseudoalteromonas marina]|uniref:hypothetical protein n=1 Tax=Pseudoalteromonas marina TaxID=267375 RepID=UPI003C42F7A5
MAIDTLAKRNSVLSIQSIILPIPDGTVGNGDRQTLLRRYSGILAGEVIAVLSKGIQAIQIRIGISI